MPVACDSLIVGGGPGGCALAILLARAGRRVVLVDRGRAHYSGPYETVLASSRAMLARTGLEAVVAACAEADPLRHGAIWGGPEIMWREERAAGWLLRRGEFDRALREAASRYGVLVRCPAIARVEGRRVVVIGANEQEEWTAASLVIATGRAGNHERAESPVRTLAFTFVGEPTAADRDTAVVEAVPAGWIWTHVPPSGPASAAVFVDAGGAPLERRQRLVAAFAAATGPAARLHDRRLIAANDATAAWCPSDGDVLRIGDAAATIDPLASQGVEKALAAADHAAAIVATAIEQPTWWSHLCRVHAHWERGLAAAHRAAAAEWYRREERFATEPFWCARRPAVEPPVPRSDVPLAVADAIAPATVLIREGPRFVARPGFVDRNTGDEASHVGLVPIAPVLAAFHAPCPIAEAVTRAGRDSGLFVLPPRAVHAAMLELVRRGWLRQAR